jgi:predicted RNase H-like HicB family nuclease
MRKEADLYQKIVVWSDKDQCFVGTCPEIMYGGVHGDDPIEVFKELGEAIEEVIEIYKQDKTPLPKPKGVALTDAA